MCCASFFGQTFPPHGGDAVQREGRRIASFFPVCTRRKIHPPLKLLLFQGKQ